MLDLALEAKKVKKAGICLLEAKTEEKDFALECLAKALVDSKEKILQANEKDLESAKKAGLDESFLDRLSLKMRLDDLKESVLDVRRLKDPVGETIEKKTLPNGLKVALKRTPLGVLGVIYESRPNVTIECAALAIKSGNGLILRGGSETLSTNKVLVELVQKALLEAALPKEAVFFIDDPDRAHVLTMLHLYDSIDLIIPRGGKALQDFCRSESKIPVITGGVGICHLYVDKSADFDKSLNVIFNAKVQRPTVCNALDTLLIHESIYKTFLPKVIERLKKANVTFRIDKAGMDLIDDSSCKVAEDGDFDQEWLSLILSIRSVKNLDQAIEHIRQHSTFHSDGILTEDQALAESFLRRVDSSVVYHNASTRFTDGGQLGLGAEVAVSTQKVHARGPLGLEALTSYKWVVEGNYQVREGK